MNLPLIFPQSPVAAGADDFGAVEASATSVDVDDAVSTGFASVDFSSGVVAVGVSLGLDFLLDRRSGSLPQPIKVAVSVATMAKARNLVCMVASFSDVG